MTQPRRFYKQVSVRPAEDGFEIALDQRVLKTPRGQRFAAPTRALAEAMAAEWEAQGELIAPASMPLSQLAFAAIDVVAGRREEQARGLLKYLEADLLCHRASEPEGLAARQAAAWDPVLSWAERRYGACPPVVAGVIAAEVPPEVGARYAAELSRLDDFRSTGLAQATTLAGSLLIGLALMEGRIDARQAFEAAALDSLWSLDRWGEDAEARAALDRLERDLASVGRFFAALA